MPAFFDHLNGVPDVHQVGGDIDALAIDGEMVVPHKMASLGSRIDEPQAIDHVVQSAFEQYQQVGTGDAFLAVGFFKEKPKLFFGQPIRIFDFLLFTKLDAVIGGFPPSPLPVLPRTIPPPVKSAFVGVATVPF